MMQQKVFFGGCPIWGGYQNPKISKNVAESPAPNSSEGVRKEKDPKQFASTVNLKGLDRRPWYMEDEIVGKT